MNIKRAIEILDPEHVERYESIETVNEACRMGRDALMAIMRGYGILCDWDHDVSLAGISLVFERRPMGKRDGRCADCGEDLEDFPPWIDFCPFCGREIARGTPAERRKE